MKKSIFMALAGMMFVSTAANAISVSGQAGEHYTNLGVGFGTESTGLAVTGNWLHNDDDGDAAGLGLGLNIPSGHSRPPWAAKAFTPIQTTAMRATRRRLAAVCSGKSATASVCSANTITLGFTLQRHRQLSGSQCRRALYHYASSEHRSRLPLPQPGG